MSLWKILLFILLSKFDFCSSIPIINPNSALQNLLSYSKVGVILIGFMSMVLLGVEYLRHFNNFQGRTEYFY